MTTIARSPAEPVGLLDPRREWTPVIDQHASWLAVNSIQGCPKSCDYCFLKQRGQTRVRPVQLHTPAETVRLLMDSDLYGADRTVALFTWTDVMAVRASRDYLAELLAEFVAAGLPNAVVLITKCRVPAGTIEAIRAVRAAGLRVIVYLSYSGMDADIEVGVRHEEIRENFPALHAAGIPVVHYWRPAFPASATIEVMTRVLDTAARYAVCTMAAGLKVEPEALDRLAVHWPELATTPGVTDAECVYPEPYWEFIHRTTDRHPGHPVFHTNACALAYTLGEADRFGIYGGQVCTQRNHCPKRQRMVCAAPADIALPSPDVISVVLERRGLADVSFELVSDRRELRIEAAVPNRVVSALTQDLGVRVVVSGQGSDAYWSSGTAGAQPLVIKVAGS
ncbi:radical SAM protein [Acrocarpospora sp. B8E8]|uniref:radical SAM protein n=1 Tax=Acrocarpospora sp. B8E8 TaxID=3153572 RepID=UPI00325EDF0B